MRQEGIATALLDKQCHRKNGERERERERESGSRLTDLTRPQSPLVPRRRGDPGSGRAELMSVTRRLRLLHSPGPLGATSSPPPVFEVATSAVFYGFKRITFWMRRGTNDVIGKHDATRRTTKIVFGDAKLIRMFLNM